MQTFSTIYNNSSIAISEISVIPYKIFCQEVLKLMVHRHNHCLNYYCIDKNEKYKFICLIANDTTHEIYLLSHDLAKVSGNSLESITPLCNAFHIFEREIYEKEGIMFKNHPWLKPLRFPSENTDIMQSMANYPFYKIEGEELHLVDVGPVHAGIIEPGHFRFICNGEKVLHLEIQLGYQHRNIEKLFIEKNHILHQSVLAESIAGDTVVGHGMAYTNLIESFCETNLPEQLLIERCIALEMERIAMHIADTSALCTDVAYQFGQVVNEALRTLIINTTQSWCGNRFGKGLIRPFGSNYQINRSLATKMLRIVSETEARFIEISDRIYLLASILDRFESIGIITEKQVHQIGAVGMVARHTGVPRDIRVSHPFGYYPNVKYDAVILHEGDVWARGMLRKTEAQKSFQLVKKLLEKLIAYDSVYNAEPNFNPELNASAFSVSLVEGWRGEICHSALTNEKGEIVHYKVKDPSIHNWTALALAMRNQEISDFPICNKSFNLSYCGHDL